MWRGRIVQVRRNAMVRMKIIVQTSCIMHRIGYAIRKLTMHLTISKSHV